MGHEMIPYLWFFLCTYNYVMYFYKYTANKDKDEISYARNNGTYGEEQL